ncbi:MAG: hypothetical protein II534_03890 [Clostridia bacterium]|nr:hypothetical protein [Clostridia bacterium]
MKKFKLFDMNRNGPGVSKDEKPLKPNLWNLPRFWFRHFTKTLNLNFVMLPIWLVPLAVVYLYITAPSMPSQMSTAYTSIYGAYLLRGGSPAWSSLLGVYGAQLNLQTYGTARIWITVGLGILLAVIWGWINVGATYCAKGMFTGDPVFIWSDFKYSIKRNLWQGLALGLIDFVLLGVIGYDIYFFSRRGGGIYDFFFFAICAVAIIYMFMRYYIYLMLVTFDIKIRKILKNALIFSILGIGRNLMTSLAIVLLIGLNVLLVIAFWPINFFVPLILPIIYLLPTVCLFKVYGAYPVIEKYMIKN